MIISDPAAMRRQRLFKALSDLDNMRAGAMLRQAGVAEWQTRQTQNLLSERTWEFKSPRPHQAKSIGYEGERAQLSHRLSTPEGA
jgi:hypothetical protein